MSQREGAPAVATQPLFIPFSTNPMKCSHALKLVAILAVTSSAAPLPSRISPNEIADKSAMGLRLISIEENVAPVWKTEDDVFKLIQGNVGFVCGSLSLLYHC